VYEHLHGRVFPYVEAQLGTWDLTDPDRIAAISVNLVAWLFLVLVCGNVALLMFARAAAREGEIIVRTALGASRRRIVSQLFAEALVLGMVAGLVGVGAAAYGLERLALKVLVGDGAPAFWFHASLSPRTVVYAAALVVVTAVMTGAMPGLMLTSKKVDARLRSASAGGGGLRLGGVWTAIIVVQVAATVTFPAIGWFVGSEAARIRAYEPAFATEEFLATGLRLNARVGWTPSDSTGRDAYSARLARAAQELTERLEAEPWVKGVTRTATLPGTSHRWRRIEMDDGGEAPRSELDEKGPGRWVSGGVVAPDFFDVLGAGAIQGRTFHQGDAHPDARTVVVNEAFVDRVLGGRNPVGRRLRYLGSQEGWDGVAIGDDPGPWYRIVGVVPDLGLSNGARGDSLPAGLYHAVSDESLRATTLLVRVNGVAESFASRVREITPEVEPDLALLRLQTLEKAKEEELRAYTWGVFLIIAVSGVAVLLSLAGIYAAMSFAVARRTREIGVRVALGAGSVRIVWAIFRRPLAQVGTGLALGLWITAVLSGTLDSAGFWGKPILVLLGYGAFLTSVCLLACAEPVRRALAVEPREALAAE
jgi:predicted permease